MKKILFIICCLISLNVLANSDSMLLEQQMNVLKSMGVNNPELMGTLSTMQKDFADDDFSGDQTRQMTKETYFSTAGRSNLDSIRHYLSGSNAALSSLFSCAISQ